MSTLRTRNRHGRGPALERTETGEGNSVNGCGDTRRPSISTPKVSPIFLFHRRTAGSSFDCLDVLLTVSIAVAVAETTGTVTITVDHAEIHLGEEDARRLRTALDDKARWPKWCVATEVAPGRSKYDSHVTVVLVGRPTPPRPDLTARGAVARLAGDDAVTVSVRRCGNRSRDFGCSNWPRVSPDRTRESCCRSRGRRGQARAARW